MTALLFDIAAMRKGHQTCECTSALPEVAAEVVTSCDRCGGGGQAAFNYSGTQACCSRQHSGSTEQELHTRWISLVLAFKMPCLLLISKLLA